MGFYKKWIRDSKMKHRQTQPSHEGDTSISVWDYLPSGCPIKTGGPCPPECRFTPEFFLEQIKNGELPVPEVGCHLRQVCGLYPPRCQSPEEDVNQMSTE